MVRARTSEAKKDRRKHLLATALEVFYENGFAAARIEEIAERAGISKGTVYLYFPSKEAILYGLIEDMTTPRIAQLEAIADAPIAINDIIANIARFGPFVIRETDLPKLAKVIIAESRSFPELADQYRRHVLERLLKVVAGALERARERGEASFEDAEITARLIMAPIALASIWTGMFGKDGEAAFDIDGFLSTHAQMLTKALAPEQDT